MRTASPPGCKLKLTTNSEVLPPHSHETGSAARASAGPGAAPRWPVRQALLYQDRTCPLRICGRKILPAVVAGGGLV